MIYLIDEGHRCLKQASEVTADSGIVKCSLTFAIWADWLLTLTQVQCKETTERQITGNDYSFRMAA